MTTQNPLRLAVPLLLCAATAAQNSDFLATFSKPEVTLSGSAGTVLRFLQPNEIVHLDWITTPCAVFSAEKWAPRTCFHTMAGDEDADAQWWEPTLFGSIDALLDLGPSATVVGGSNARSIWYSPSVPMGLALSGAPGLRPGDVGRIVRDPGFNEGRVQYFLRQEQVAIALGAPAAAPIDVDAIAVAPGIGVFLSLDQDTPALLACGAALVRDGDIVLVPDAAIAWTPNQTVGAVAPNSAVVVYTEAQVNLMVTNATIADRFGACVGAAIDVEALEIDRNAPFQVVTPCAILTLQIPSLIFATETMTGGGLCTTDAGGQIYNGPCGPVGTPCGAGPTSGVQIGIRPATAAIGAPSHVNALAATRTLRYAMEAQQHVVPVPAGGLPFGSQLVELSSPWPIHFVFWTPGAALPATATQSAPNPFGLPLTFPDFYPMPTYHTFALTVGGFANWPMLPIPPGFVGNVVFQSLAFAPGGSLELSTPVTIEFQ